jgi:hypothetical protein
MGIQAYFVNLPSVNSLESPADLGAPELGAGVEWKGEANKLELVCFLASVSATWMSLPWKEALSKGESGEVESD